MDIEPFKKSSDILCFTSQMDGSSIALESYAVENRIDEQTDVFANLSVSNDRVTWEKWDGTTKNLDNGEKLYVKGNNPDGITISDGLTVEKYHRFNMTG